MDSLSWLRSVVNSINVEVPQVEQLESNEVYAELDERSMPIEVDLNKNLPLWSFLPTPAQDKYETDRPDSMIGDGLAKAFPTEASHSHVVSDGLARTTTTGSVLNRLSPNIFDVNKYIIKVAERASTCSSVPERQEVSQSVTTPVRFPVLQRLSLDIFDVNKYMLKATDRTSVKSTASQLNCEDNHTVCCKKHETKEVTENDKKSKISTKISKRKRIILSARQFFNRLFKKV